MPHVVCLLIFRKISHSHRKLARREPKTREFYKLIAVSGALALAQNFHDSSGAPTPAQRRRQPAPTPVRPRKALAPLRCC